MATPQILVLVAACGELPVHIIPITSYRETLYAHGESDHTYAALLLTHLFSRSIMRTFLDSARNIPCTKL